VIIDYKRLHELQVAIYRMRVIIAIAKCIQRSIDTENEVRVFGNLDLKSRICECTLLYGFGNRIPKQATLYLFMGLYIYYTISV
jgi:hypothetical protein